MNTLAITLISLAVTSHWGLVLILLHAKTSMSFYKCVCPFLTLHTAFVHLFFLDPCVRRYMNLHYMDLVRYRCKWFWILILSFMYSGLSAALCCISANPVFLYLSYGQIIMVIKKQHSKLKLSHLTLGPNSLNKLQILLLSTPYFSI